MLNKIECGFEKIRKDIIQKEKYFMLYNFVMLKIKIHIHLPSNNKKDILQIVMI